MMAKEKTTAKVTGSQWRLILRPLVPLADDLNHLTGSIKKRSLSVL
jgi:hypothetical protein